MSGTLSSNLKIYSLVVLSGAAALSWESLWQVKSTLALGVSAWGTALTLAVTMGGMCVGALVMGQALKDKAVARPLRVYGALEIVIGLSGLFLAAAFKAVENLDTHIYAAVPESAALIHILGIALSIGLPAMCMGATLPVLGLVSRQYGTSLAVLYGLNTFGAAVGIMLAAFLWIPLLGITHAGWLIAAVNIAVGVVAWMMKPGVAVKEQAPIKISQQENFRTALLLAFVTGFATFMLEVSWFRSMTAAFLSATDAFAIMLAVVLVSLALGAKFVKVLKKRNVALGLVLGAAGAAILLATPVVERMDLFMFYSTQYPILLYTRWFMLTLYIIGLPVLLLGVALPWLLDEQDSSKKWGILYGANTLAAIVGSVCAAWIFLPNIGFARTAWLTGAIVVLVGILIAPKQRRIALAVVGVAALCVAVVFESGVGRERAQGALSFGNGYVFEKLLAAYEGPDSTVSAVEYQGGRRILFIDGFSTTEQAAAGEAATAEHYMPWMGHMPMLLHPDPKRALVICFGTGQTANAVRRENPEVLDIVDINKNVFKLAPYFTANEGVLEDERVRPIIMDGRAYMRRTDQAYDVITLEPMPPHFAGVNALYSKEFYELAREKMTEDGVIAQWLPFHLIAPHYSASIARTFQDVFPNSILWIDPASTTGILLGSKNDGGELGQKLHGFRRPGTSRDMSEEEVRQAILLNREEMARYGGYGEIISDDNQLLAYGEAAYLFRELKEGRRNPENFALIKEAKEGR